MPHPLRGSKRQWQFHNQNALTELAARTRSTRFPASQYVALAQAAADPHAARPDLTGPDRRTAAATVPSGAGVQRPRSLEATRSAKSVKSRWRLTPWRRWYKKQGS